MVMRVMVLPVNSLFYAVRNRQVTADHINFTGLILLIDLETSELGILVHKTNSKLSPYFPEFGHENDRDSGRCS